MDTDTLFDEALGYFLVPSCVMVINDKHERPESLASKATDARPTKWGDTLFVLDHSQLTPAILNHELTRMHEQAHYRQLMSTPLGLLLWRTLNALNTHVSFAMRAISDVRPIQLISLPIDRWLLSGGIRQLWVALQHGAEFAPDRVSQRFKRLGETLPYLETIANEIAVLKKFMTALLHRTSMTIGEFVEVANESFEVLRRVSDAAFPCRWTTSLPLESPLLPTGHFSGSELIEAAARFEERIYLEAFPDSANRVQAWEAQSIHGVYKPAYRWLMEKIGESEASLALLDVAFMTAIDPTFSNACNHELFVEDVLPSYRLSRLVPAALADFWPEESGELNEYVRSRLCNRAGLTTPAAVTEEGLSARFSGENSWGYDAKVNNSTDVSRWFKPEIMSQHVESEVRRAMSLRRDRPDYFLKQDLSLQEAFRPIMIYYRDHVVFGLHNADTDPEFYIKLLNCHWMYLHNGLSWALLSKGDLSELKRCDDVFWDRIINKVGPEVFERLGVRLDLLWFAQKSMGQHYLALVGLQSKVESIPTE